MIFQEKYCSYYTLSTDQISVWLSLIREILGNTCIIIVGFEVIHFEINLTFLIKPFFQHDQKVKTKTYITWKELLRFFIFQHFWRAIIETNKNIFLESESRESNIPISSLHMRYKHCCKLDTDSECLESSNLVFFAAPAT